MDGKGIVFNLKFSTWHPSLPFSPSLTPFRHFTEVDIEALTINEAIIYEKIQYVENGCWINVLNDHYKDTLMRRKRGSLAKNMTKKYD